MNAQHLNEFRDLKFMPVTAQKRPIVKNWQHSTAIHDLSNCEGVGLVCGALSGGLEVIDVDQKYSLDGKLYDNYKRLIHAADDSLLAKLFVQSTKGGGYHMVYRCQTISGNLKLANRPTTADERKDTYNQTYKTELSNGSDDATAKAKAKKASDNDKVRVLLETRGEGGYIMCHPSAGYEVINLDFYGINEITVEQRDILHACARQLNEVFDEVEVPKAQIPKVKGEGKSPFDDYNERGDIVQLLVDHGWKFVRNRGNKIHFQRPGQTSAETSGNYDTSNGWFSVFSTSTEFEPNHGYRPYAVFAVLECDKDFSAASKKLYEMGYGDRTEKKEKEKAPSTRVIQSRVNPDDNDLSFLATPEDYDGYLQQVRDGTLPLGLTTGSQLLDEYFLLKEGNMVMTVGHDNSGKTVWIWWLLLIAAMYHKWEGVIYSSENSTGGFMRKMMQFYWGKPLRGHNAQTHSEMAEAKAFIEKHFRIIKADEQLYNYKDILNLNKKIRALYPNTKYGLIDPYNSLKIDLSGFSKLSTHEYHYEALSELKAYGTATKYGWFINNHPVTEALRKVDSEGYPAPPHKADTEGGGKAAFKADEFLTIHRKAQHPIDWNVAEIYVRKVKDYDTGGKQTPLDEPVKFRMNKNQCSYAEVRTDGLPPIDPIQRWHQTRTATCEEEKHWADRKDFQTFEQFKANHLPPEPKKEEDWRKHPLDGYEPDDEEQEILRTMF